MRTVFSVGSSYIVLDLALPEDTDKVEYQRQTVGKTDRAAKLREQAILSASSVQSSLGLSIAAAEEIRGLDFKKHTEEVVPLSAMISYC